jgi:lysine 2,3-aminomutase
MEKPIPSAAQSVLPLRSVPALAAAGLVAAQDARALEEVAARYAVAVTQEMAALIDGTPDGQAMARQFIPDARELRSLPAELADPIGDGAHSPVEGVVHRYADRCLLKVIHSCPVYCRFCFRREMVGPGGKTLAGKALDEALAYIAATPAIREVILTGGDPFMLSARRAGGITARLAAISHVARLRWHTRVPMVDPSRVTPAFARALVAEGAATSVAIHANHPREFTPAARAALALLRDTGVTLLSQSVLLKGVNADAATLAGLLEAFQKAGVAPYYLHHPDLAPGTGHFRLPIDDGLTLMADLRRLRPGEAMPAYVLDIPGGHGKARLESEACEAVGEGRWRVRDRLGLWHDYADA